MISDHTKLLEENEAFVADLNEMHGNRKIEEFKDMVLMRSPAYFTGDLLKLKIVSWADLIKRSILAGKDASSFFVKLHTGLVLSTKGERSCADMMSGGDFDGDKAWVCWNPILTDQVCDCSPPNTSSPDYQIQKSDKESELAFKSKIFDRVAFSWNFRHHQVRLGILSNKLDSVLDSIGFDSEEANIIGREAFLQVDHPYQIRKVPDNISKKISHIKEPHWRGFKVNTYKSNKALGILWDYVEEKIKSVLSHNKQNFTGEKAEINSYIVDQIDKRINHIKKNNDQNGAAHLLRLRQKMKNAAEQYNREVSNYLKENGQKADDEFDCLFWNWLKERHEFWRHELFKGAYGDDMSLSAAVLYEQVWELGVNNSSPGEEKVYKFAWHVAHDILTRIIGDGKAKERGSGLPPCIDREFEKDLFDAFKKK